QHTKTTVGGRDRERHGSPIKISELVAQLDGAASVPRPPLHPAASVNLTKEYLRAAFQSQLDGKGFSLVEVLTMCPTDWFVPPDQGPAFLERRLVPTYPLGVIKGG